MNGRGMVKKASQKLSYQQKMHSHDIVSVQYDFMPLPNRTLLVWGLFFLPLCLVLESGRAWLPQEKLTGQLPPPDGG